MKAVVTGVAGFVGSNLAERLLASGWSVVGIDSLTGHYEREVKLRNLAHVVADERFTFSADDPIVVDPVDAFADADVVFHLAAQPGVRPSWRSFEAYAERNVLLTQRILELAVRTGVPRVVYASSSSVYGAAAGRVAEDHPCRPHSPYGVTKLAGEQLCGAYSDNFGLTTVMLRLFTVYGPRQRPDMAVHRLIRAALLGTSFEMYGDGTQVRDLTYVDDVTDALARAALGDLAPRTVINVAGGDGVSLSGLVDLVGRVVGRPIEVRAVGTQAGDVPSTSGDTTRAAHLLGWEPTVHLASGVARQVDAFRLVNDESESVGGASVA